MIDVGSCGRDQAQDHRDQRKSVICEWWKAFKFPSLPIHWISTQKGNDACISKTKGIYDKLKELP